MPKSVFTDDYAHLLAVLVTARRAAHVTQTELAERLNKPQSHVSKIERGERRIDVIEFISIAQALGADPTLLFDRVLRR